MHSEDTRASMNRFRIGRIQGPWKNFVPPIQGGRFRSASEEVEDVEIESDGSKTPESSKPASMVFDLGGNELRMRASSLSSISSTGDSDHREGPSFLDTQTKMEIELDVAKYPTVDPITQQDIVFKYRELEEQIRAKGLYDCNYSAYGWEAARCSVLFVLMLVFWQKGWYTTSGTFMGMFWSQLVFTAHDAGHIGITHNYTIDTLIGMIIAAPIGGLSLGWWKLSHNIHHIVTNSPEHDPDNQHLPFLAVNQRFLGNIFSTYHERIIPYDDFAKRLVPYQKYFYYPILTLGRFNLYLQSWLFLLLGKGPRHGPAWWHHWFEIAGNIVFWIWFGWGIVGHIPGHWNRFAFVLTSHMLQVLLHVQFTVSHFAMSTADLGPTESFPQKMLRTTMDVDCPPWLDFFHGGLQFQAVHHLFPRLPRHNLRRAQKLVIEFCKEVDIPYALYGFVDGNKKVLGRLAEVSRQAAILAGCQRVVAERGDYLHDLRESAFNVSSTKDSTYHRNWSRVQDRRYEHLTSCG
jgi:delta8-fatty-acid desaturase